MIRIHINGQSRQCPQGSTLQQLLASLALTERRLALELNQHVIPRSQYAEQQLREGDRIEIVHAIGGG